MKIRSSISEVSTSWLVKVLLVLIIYNLSLVASSAQENGGGQQFSPDKFDAELRQYITEQAKLTEQEAEKFFPVYKEMQAKQRVVFGRQRELLRAKPEGEKACLEAIRQRDENELEMKRIQKNYHEKFLKQLPASKVYAILRAEDMFYRNMLRRGNPNRHSGMNPFKYNGAGFNPWHGMGKNAGKNHNWKKRE